MQKTLGMIITAIMFLLLPLFFWMSGLTANSNERMADHDEQIVSLPSVQTKGEISVEEAIFSRRSLRSYADQPLKLTDVSQLLWAAAGKTVDGVTGATRAYPSAGGIYPLRVYLVAGRVDNLDPGIYRYEWRRHGLIPIVSGDQREQLARAALGQGMMARAPASLLFTGELERVTQRYGSRGRDRYLAMDVGGAGQNVHLQAEALGLGTVIVGAFNDRQVRALLGGTEESPLYIMPLGRRP